MSRTVAAPGRFADGMRANEKHTPGLSRDSARDGRIGALVG